MVWNVFKLTFDPVNTVWVFRHRTLGSLSGNRKLSGDRQLEFPWRNQCSWICGARGVRRGRTVTLETGRNGDPELPIANEVWDTWGRTTERTPDELLWKRWVSKQTLSLEPSESLQHSCNLTLLLPANHFWMLIKWWSNDWYDNKSAVFLQQPQCVRLPVHRGRVHVCQTA